MRKNYWGIVTALTLGFLTPSVCISQINCDSVFIKTYSSGGNMEPFTTTSLSNNDVLITGRASLTPAGNYQLMAMKLSSSGSVIWSSVLGGTNNDMITGNLVLTDGSYLLYGTVSSFGFNNGKVLLIHISENGALLWTRQIGNITSTKDKIKELKLAGDGDLVGTFNMNDSTNQSDPVVFKIGLDGTIRWIKRFESSGNDSFTCLAAGGDKIYVGGFTTQNNKSAVLMVLNGTNGNVISSDKPYYFDTSYSQEIINLEFFNGILSYGLWAYKQFGTTQISRVLLIQADATGLIKSETKISIDGDPNNSKIKRSRENDFFILRSEGTAPTVAKLNNYNTIEWSTLLSNNSYYSAQQNHGFDVTNFNGVVSAGYYKNYLTGDLNRMIVAKVGESGSLGDCTQRGFTFFSDTVFLRQSSFPWASVSTLAPILNELVSLAPTPLPVTISNLCDTTFCVDATPLPPPCNKTSLVEYQGSSYVLTRDALSMPDGSKIVAGEYDVNGFITKISNNGDVVWSKKIDEFSHNSDVIRLIKAGPNEVYAFINNGYVIDHGVIRSVKVVKLNTDGSVLLTKELIRSFDVEMADAEATPDGGFVIIINEGYGSGSIYSGVIRFDKNLNVVWKKEIKHFTAVPVFRSIFCTKDAVYIGHDSYDGSNSNKIGVQKLSYSTGENVWSKGFTITNETLGFNKIIVQNDTVYAFINKNKAIDYFNDDYKIVMLRLNSSGGIIDAKRLNCDNIVAPNTYRYIDYVRPTVTQSADNNFVMSNAVKTSTGKALNFTKFDKNGLGIWSKNYTQLSSHSVLNVHTQDSGTYVIGTVNRTMPTNPRFTNSFILKAGSNGEIVGTGAGICSPENRPFSTSTIVVNEADSRVDSVVNLSYFTVTAGNITCYPVKYDATLFCNQVAYCSTMSLAGKSGICNLQDTLRYYIANNNCGAVSRWAYDSSFFSYIANIADTLLLLPLKPGVSVIKVEIESPCSIINDSISVSVLLSATSLNLGKDTIICPNNSIRLNAGKGYQSYLWNDLSTDSTLFINVPGTYYVTVKDFCGGQFADTIKVTSVANAFFISGPPEICKYDTAVLKAPPGYNRYQWTPASILAASNNVARVYPTQTTLYFVQAKHISGCAVKDSFLVSVKSAPPINIGNDTVICYNQSLQLYAPTGFINYLWSNGERKQTTLVTKPGSYSVAAGYLNGCYSNDTIIIKNYTFIQPALGKDTAICEGSNFKLTPGIYKSYLWNDGSTGRFLPVTNTGLYSVVIVDANGCGASDSIAINKIYSNPSNFLKSSDNICQFAKLTVEPLNSFKEYLWSTGSTSFRITVEKPGTYLLTVKDANNCVGKDTILIVQKDCFNGVMIPTAFTPNGDVLNDVFRAKVFGSVESFTLEVFDRYGQLVFKTSNPLDGWDGKFKGLPLNNGVFVWQCTYKLTGMEMGYQKGFVTLIR